MGGGWQAMVAYINLGCYYVFGLPLGFLLGYLVHWGVEVNLSPVNNKHFISNLAQPSTVFFLINFQICPEFLLSNLK